MKFNTNSHTVQSRFRHPVIVIFLATVSLLCPVPTVFAEKKAPVTIQSVPGFEPVNVRAGRVRNPEKVELPPLHSAIEQRRGKEATRLIEKGADINQRDHNGFSPLIYAARSGNADLVKLLIKQGAEIDVAGHSGRTPLLEAVINNHREIVDLLIASGSNLRPFDYLGKQKIYSGRAVTELYGKNREIRTPAGGSIIEAPVYAATAKIIEQKKLTLAPLGASLRGGQDEMSRYLLTTYYNYERDKTEIDAALLTAIQYKNISLQTINLLLKKQADVNGRNVIGYTPLMFAASQGKVEIINVLLAKGAEINAVNPAGKTPLLLAISKGDREAVALLLKHGASTSPLPYSRKPSKGGLDYRQSISRGESGVGKSVGYTQVVKGAARKNSEADESMRLTPDPFEYAARFKREDIALLLLDMGVKVSWESIEKTFPQVLQNASYRLADRLIAQGADVNMRLIPGIPLLNGMLGIKHLGWKQKQDTVAFLCERGAGVNVTDQTARGLTPLHHTAKRGEVAMAAILLKHGADINGRSRAGEKGYAHYDGTTPLVTACIENHKEMISFLLQKGADPNLTDKQKRHPFFINKIISNAETVKLLLEHGADPNYQGGNLSGYPRGTVTPICVALTKDNVEVAHLLLEHGADIRADCIQGMVVEAMVKENDTLVHFLVESGAELNEARGGAGKKGFSPLMYAAEIGHFNYLQLFLDHGADIDYRNERGDTALIKAAVAGNVEGADFLLAHGAGVNIQNEKGETALFRAAATDNLPLVRILVEHGADLSAANREDLSPYWLAKQNNNEEMAEYLAAHGADTAAYIAFAERLESLRKNNILPKTTSVKDISPVQLTFFLKQLSKMYGITDPENYRPDPILSSPDKTWQAHKQALLDNDESLFKKTLITPDHDLAEIFALMEPEKRRNLARKMRPIQQITLEGNRAKYRIKREMEGQDITFYIYFVRVFGEWKIENY